MAISKPLLLGKDSQATNGKRLTIRHFRRLINGTHPAEAELLIEADGRLILPGDFQRHAPHPGLAKSLQCITHQHLRQSPPAKLRSDPEILNRADGALIAD